MVIGNGLVANRFMKYKDDKSITIFASGVSNSKETNYESYKREFTLLKQTLSNYDETILVYFSTCSIEDPDLATAPYIIHKKEVEEYITENAERYYIFRVSNLAGISNNPYTLLNYFIFHIASGHIINIWKNAYRNIIGINDMHGIINYILNEGETMNTITNIANTKNYSISYIIRCIEEHLNKKTIKKEINKGTDYKIDVSAVEPIINKLNIQFDDNYLPTLLKNYYHSR
ncbi:hypothetical protein BH20BAC1_BH20BAC1_17450 [soil metagenome]